MKRPALPDARRLHGSTRLTMKAILTPCTPLRRTMARVQPKQLVVCINNDGCPAALEKRKIYVSLRDPIIEKQDLLRIIDESGEDYLYPKALFRVVVLSVSVKKAVMAAA
jgi:hypothetical protein